jgi:hypothetical protein
MDANEMHDTANKGNEIMMNEMTVYNVDQKMIERKFLDVNSYTDSRCTHTHLQHSPNANVGDSNAGLW